ncbi:beta-lactamase/transpeptidase-like protein [Aspergillus heterothallicus]
MRFLLLQALSGLCAASSAQFPKAPELIAAPDYKGCPPDGPLLPRPTDLANSKYIQDAAGNLTAMLDSAVKGEIKASWIVENVSFSLALVSPYGPSGTEDNVMPSWEYHHRGKITTVVFSELMLLKSGVDLQAPVTDFLPQLRSPMSKIPWENITLEMLADHLAGIPPNAFYEFYFLNSFHESLGLPHLEASKYPRCGVLGLNAGCTREEMVESFLTEDQVVPINSRPILGDTVYKPLNLLNTGVSPGDTDKAAIPPGVSGWGSDYGFNAPGGGLYSTTNDLSIFLSSILNYGILPTPADVRKWFKPVSTTSSLNTLVGRLWEILREADLLPPKHAHTIAVIDQYGVGLSILTAGPVDAMDIMYRAVLSTWTSNPHDITQENEKIGVTLDLDDGTSLKLSSLTRGNASVIEAIQTIWTAEYLALGFGILPDEFHVYPTGLEIPIPASEAQGLLTEGHRHNSHHSSCYCNDDDNNNNNNHGENGDFQFVRQEWRINLDIIPLGGSLMSDLPGQDTAT